MYIPVSPTLSPLVALRALFLSAKFKNNSSIQYFSHARGGLIEAIKLIAISKSIQGKLKIWLPAYICDTVPIALIDQSIEVAYYPVESLEPDYLGMKNLNLSVNDFFLLVHYFGFMISAQDALEFCNANHLVMIEDCAHSISRNIKRGAIGSTGAAAIFGMRKILPVPNGGILRTNLGITTTEQSRESIRVTSIYRKPMKMVAQWFLKSLGISWSHSIDKDVYQTMQHNYYYFNFLEPISKASLKIMNALNLTRIIESRRLNYSIVLKELSGINSIQVPKSLQLVNEEIVPWIFFFYHENSNYLINTLIANGVAASSFPTLPLDIYRNVKWPRENLMYERSVSLPIHQDIPRKDLMKMIALVKKFA